MRAIWSLVTFPLRRVIPFKHGAVCTSLLWLGLSTTQVLSPDLQASPQDYTGDNSDWWSGLRTLDSEEGITVQKREPAASNFRILRISLDEDMFNQAAGNWERRTKSKGVTPQAVASKPATFLPEIRNESTSSLQGEVDFSFYLFVDGPDWQGSDKCLPSRLISVGLSTASGLRLGQTPSEVRAVLGKPSVRRKNQFIYSFLVKKRTSVKDLKEARIRHPEMSEQEFHANYDYYDLSVGIDTRFVDSKLSFLAVTKSETN